MDNPNHEHSKDAERIIPSNRGQNTEEGREANLAPGDCRGCGASFPYCDCWSWDPANDDEADAREGWYTSMELLD